MRRVIRWPFAAMLMLHVSLHADADTDMLRRRQMSPFRRCCRQPLMLPRH